MRFYRIFCFLLMSFAFLVNCSSPDFSGPHLAFLLSNNAPLVAGPHLIKRFTPEITQAKTLFSEKETQFVYGMPDEQGILLVGEKASTLIDGAGQYAPVSFEKEEFIGAVMTTPGNILTLDKQGVLQRWQWEQKQEGETWPLLQTSASFPLQRGIFSSDGKQLLTLTGKDSIAKLWDSATGKLMFTFTGATEAVVSAAFSKDGSVLALASLDGRVYFWFRMISAGKPTWFILHTPLVHEQGTQWVAFAHSHPWLVTGDGKGQVRVWEYTPDTLGSLLQRKMWWQHQAPVETVAFSPDDQTIISVAQDQSIVVQPYSPDQVFVVQKTSSNDPSFLSAAFSPKGDWIAITLVNKGDSLQLWETKTFESGSPIPRFVFGDRTAPEFQGVAWQALFSPDGNFLVSGHVDGKGRIWDLRGKDMPGFMTPPLSYLSQNHQKDIKVLSFSKDGSLLATGSLDQTVKLFRFEEGHRGEYLSTLSGHTDEITDISFSQDGKRLITASMDKTVRLWDVSDPGKPIFLALLPHLGAVKGAFFTQNDQQVVTGGTEGLIRIWDIVRISPPLVITHFSQEDEMHKPIAITSMNLLSDGTSMIFAGIDGQVRMWDIAQKQLKASFACFPRKFGDLPIRSLQNASTVKKLLLTADPSVTLQEFVAEKDKVSFSFMKE